MNGPAVGTLARDASGRVGRVMDAYGGHLYLRPVGGGREWTVREGEAEAVTAGEALRARVREDNERRRDHRR